MNIEDSLLIARSRNGWDRSDPS